MATRAPRRAALASFAALVLALSAFAPVAGITSRGDLSASPLTPSERLTGHKAPSSRLAQTDPELLARTDATPVRVMIKLDYDAVAAYAGGIEGLAATSPSVTGTDLTGSSPAEQAYGQYVTEQEQATVAALQRAVPGASVHDSLQTVYGGVSATIPASAVEQLLAVDGVVAVQYDKLNQLLTDSSPVFVNATDVYGDLGTTANAGEGVIYGNLDTGVWPEHPSFADLGNLSAPPGPARACEFGDNPLTPAADVFDCNNKLIGGAHFTDTYDAVLGDDFYAGFARDGEGHGTHTASTSGGNIVASAPIFGEDRGPIQGLAPGAWVMEYKVCGPQGCFGSDSAAAVGQAILDGVDVINFSISGGTDPFTDPVELAFLDAYAAGVFVAASAGNEGPGAGTANHLSAWTTSVAASTQSRKWQSTLTIADGGDSAEITGTAIYPDGISTDLPVVLASTAVGYTDELCLAAAPAGLFTGKIVACLRGPGRAAKGFNVLQGGAAGMILYNGPGDLFPEMSDNHWLPTIHITDGPALLAFLGAHPDTTATFTGGEATLVGGDVMSAFSSRGPAGFFLKPDVTAPGVQILAGNTPAPAPGSVASGPAGEYFQSIGGTSMSGPHVAGAAILLKAVHPEWSPGEIKSALMTTAITDVVKEDGTTPADPFDFGSGRIDIGAAADAQLTFDETAENFALLAGGELTAVHVNIASINAPVLPGRLVTTRVATNGSGGRQRFDVSVASPAGSSIVVSPDRFTLDAGESATLTITISTDATIGAQQFGTIQIDGRNGSPQHLPVAFIHTQGNVNLVQDCDADTLPMANVAQCEITAVNNSFDEQTVNLDTFTNAQLDIVDADGAGVINAHHVQLHNVVLAGAQPGVPSVDPGELFGYIPLDAFGVTPIAVGDEEIVNFDVPPFVYNGQTWSAIGVDSNGYVVVGGGTAEDNNCCNLPTGPDPARPNNMLAPFWTDLEGTDSPGIFVATLTDGVNTWLVVECRLEDFGTELLRTFQTWIGLDGEQDITYAYSAAQVAPVGQAFLVGAENIAGQGDMEAFLPTADLRVTSTDPVPGDEVSYLVFVRGAKKGLGVVTTEMTANGVPGVTIVNTEIQVTNKAKKNR